MQIRPVPEHAGPIEAAYAHAMAANEPVCVAQRWHADDRGWSLMNQLQRVLAPEGQVNYSVQLPGVIKAWHRHALQTDFWIVLHGHIKIGVHRTPDHALGEAAWSIVTGAHRPGVVIIPPMLWHGAATIGPEPAGLLYYVTRAFDPAKPDEERRRFDDPAWFPWHVVHR